MTSKVGIPRSLLYYKYFPLWNTFFGELGIETVLSPPTGKKVLNRGLEVAENELCLPVKAFLGHVLNLAKQTDFLFIPRVVSVDADGYTCPKLLGLPDMAENLIRDLRVDTKVRIISPIVDLTGKKDWNSAFEHTGTAIGLSFFSINEAAKRALKAQQDFRSKLQQGYLPTEIFSNQEKQEKGNSDLVIGIIGHSYLLYDAYLSMDLIKKIRDRNAYVITPEMLSPKEIKKGPSLLTKPLFWNYQKEIFGAAWFLMHQKLVDGIIYLPAFPCGPDSVIGTFIENEARISGMPLTPISMDEHAGEAGIETRIEAFVDMIRRRKKVVSGGQMALSSGTSIPKRTRASSISRKDMLVSFPRMGRDTHLVLQYIFKKFGIECIIPPATSERTMRLGIKYSPETICLPLKLNLGNYIEALEKGANVLIHAGGCGPCRFGFYGPLAELILREEFDYDFEFKIVEPPGSQGVQVFADFFRYFYPGRIAPIFLPVTGRVTSSTARFFDRPWIELLGLTPHDRKLWQIIKAMFNKKRAFDVIEKMSLEVRCYEANKGDTTRALNKAREWIDDAGTPEEIEEARQEGLKLFSRIDLDNSKDVLRVGLVGEFFILLEPFINFNIEEWLGNRNIYIERGTYASDWIAPDYKNEVGGISYDKLVNSASPYLKFKVGGEGIATVGHTILCAKRGFDGVIHMMPFTCMPETVAKQILPSVSHEQNIPILSLVIDEQTGKAGIETRLEAFIDLMKNRRQLVQGGRVQ